MFRIASMFVVLCGLCGCANTYHLGSLDSPEYERFQQRGAKEEFSVSLRDSLIVRGRRLEASVDSLSWYDEGSMYRYSVAAEDVNYIEFRDALAGARKGFGLGFAVGGGAAVLLTVAESSSSSFVDGGAIVPLAIVVLGLVGGFAGALAGAVVGVNDTYCVIPQAVVERNGLSTAGSSAGVWVLRWN